MRLRDAAHPVPKCGRKSARTSARICTWIRIGAAKRFGIAETRETNEESGLISHFDGAQYRLWCLPKYLRNAHG
jgi:hypothetical protein